MFDDDTGTVFRDVVTLALAGFVAIVAELLNATFGGGAAGGGTGGDDRVSDAHTASARTKGAAAGPSGSVPFPGPR